MKRAGFLFIILVLLSLCARSHARQLKIATWNIQQLGKTKIGRSSVVELIAKVITKYDMIFIQELKNPPSYECGLYTGPVICKLWDAVRKESSHAAEYNLNVTRRIGSGRAAEQYTVFYRQDLVTLEDTKVFDDTMWQFTRPPQIATFRTKGTGRKFTVVNIHTKPESARSEIPALADVVSSLPEQNGDVILSGDFNADGSYFTPSRDWHLLFDRLPSGYHLVVPDGTDTTVARSDRTYDRIIVSGHLYAHGGPSDCDVLRFDEVFSLDAIKEQGCNDGWLSCSATTYEAAKKVSDHYPVSAVYSMSNDSQNPSPRISLLL